MSTFIFSSPTTTRQSFWMAPLFWISHVSKNIDISKKRTIFSFGYNLLNSNILAWRTIFCDHKEETVSFCDHLEKTRIYPNISTFEEEDIFRSPFLHIYPKLTTKGRYFEITLKIVLAPITENKKKKIKMMLMRSLWKIVSCRYLGKN